MTVMVKKGVVFTDGKKLFSHQVPCLLAKTNI